MNRKTLLHVLAAGALLAVIVFGLGLAVDARFDTRRVTTGWETVPKAGTAKTGANSTADTETAARKEPAAQSQQETRIMQQAETMAAGYDYDGAINLLKSEQSYNDSRAMQDAVSRYEEDKKNLEAKDVYQVPHIFYHSLIVDPDRAFDTAKWGKYYVDGTNCWMTTVREFDKITQQMYDNGYVLVRLSDLVKETKDADGTVHFQPNDQLMLPKDKKPYVLSIDDWSYYHSYDDHGYATKAVLDKNGDVKCEYTDAQGRTTTGDYDVVPRLNSFIAKHPDAAYRGARGTIALTGYNGVFGYRTDTAYKTGERLDKDQKEYLDAHPDFNWDQEVSEAKKVADALKKEGWTFASHTWGHLNVKERSLDTLKQDEERFENTVENIIGPVDTIIFAFGADIGSWEGYSSDNAAYQFYKSKGYNFFCNVDASKKYTLSITDSYVRDGRIDCDGIQMWNALQGASNADVFDGMFDVKSVFDPERPTPVELNGGQGQ